MEPWARLPFLAADGAVYCGATKRLLDAGRGGPAAASTASRFAEEHGTAVVLAVFTLRRGSRVRMGAADVLVPERSLLTRETATGARREWTPDVPLWFSECGDLTVERDARVARCAAPLHAVIRAARCPPATTIPTRAKL